MTIKNKTISRRKRLRVIEDLLLNGYRGSEIHEMIGAKYGIEYGTLKNDIVDIRKEYRKDFEGATELVGSENYLASLRQMRRKALTGWIEVDRHGLERIRGRDLKLAHRCDREIAKLYGVEFRADSLEITVGKARDLLDKAMIVIFKHISDEDLRTKIVTDLAEIDE